VIIFMIYARCVEGGAVDSHGDLSNCYPRAKRHQQLYLHPSFSVTRGRFLVIRGRKEACLCAEGPHSSLQARTRTAVQGLSGLTEMAAFICDRSLHRTSLLSTILVGLSVRQTDKRHFKSISVLS